MPIDPRIALMGQAPQIESYLDKSNKAMTMKRMALLNQADEQQFADDQALRDAYKQNMVVGEDGKQTLNRGGVISALSQTNPRQAMALQKEMSDADIAQMQKQADLARELAWSINDPTSYQIARQKGIELGLPNANSLPPQYDPGFVRNMKMRTMTYKDQVDNMMRQQELRARDAGRGGGAGDDPSAPVGKAPQGYRFKPDGSLEPIPGGPAATATEKQAQKRKQDASLVVQDIGRSLDLIEKSPSAAGPYDLGLTSYIPGTPASKLDNLLDSVRANIGFDKLQAMREASPTGGALGAVSEKETAMLQATAGSLKSSMDEETLKENLKRLSNQYNDIVHGPGNGPKRYQLSFDEAGKPAARNIVNKDAVAPVLKTSQIEWAD